MGPGVLTDPFPRVEGSLCCPPFRLDELADRFGTPLYVYSLDHVERRFEAFRAAFADVPTLIAYSVKANANLALLHRLARLGAGADIVSAGELFRAERAGIPGSGIVFAGVAKTEADMEAGLAAGIRAFNVESRGEIERLDRVASRLGVVAPFAVRVNPDVVAPTPHEYTRTGHAATKFGVEPSEALDLYAWATGRASLRAVGIDVHIGSQIEEVEPYLTALERASEVVLALRERGTSLDFLDLGGGYGVPYGDAGAGIPLAELAGAVVPRVRKLGLELVIEPGRALVGVAGVLLTRVEYVKTTAGTTFVIVDGGMTELLRPSHYGGYHAVEPVEERPAAPVRTVDVVGPICEAGDFLARGRALALPEPGDLLAVRTAGAYGFAMASNYNARRRPAEAIVDRRGVMLARSRETLEDLVRGETIPSSGAEARRGGDA